MHLLQKDRAAPRKSRRASAAPGPEDREEGPLVCRRCETELGRERDAFGMRAASAVQVFPNPLGRMCKILTLSSAQNVRLEGPPTMEVTWFAGYAWQIAYCATCRAHVGWSWDATDASEPPRFFGLLLDAVASRST